MLQISHHLIPKLSSCRRFVSDCNSSLFCKKSSLSSRSLSQLQFPCLNEVIFIERAVFVASSSANLFLSSSVSQSSCTFLAISSSLASCLNFFQLQEYPSDFSIDHLTLQFSFSLYLWINLWKRLKVNSDLVKFGMGSQSISTSVKLNSFSVSLDIAFAGLLLRKKPVLIVSS
ncbi:hypothetical protein Tco_0537515 [Tanacetum coccineum]